MLFLSRPRATKRERENRAVSEPVRLPPADGILCDKSVYRLHFVRDPNTDFYRETFSSVETGLWACFLFLGWYSEFDDGICFKHLRETSCFTIRGPSPK